MTEDMTVYHPALGLEIPDVETLRIACDDEADAVIELAAFLAGRRLREEQELFGQMERLQMPPWGEPDWAPTFSHAALTPTDLRRALLALHAEEVECRGFSVDGDSVGIREAAKHWATCVARPMDAAVEAVEPRWSRRWALALDRDPDLTIDLALLMGAALYPPDDSVLQLDSMYVEGLITSGEATARIVHSLLEWETPVLPGLDPAYLDTCGAVEALDEALRKGPAAVLVGPESSGRSHLAVAFHEWERQRDGSPPAGTCWLRRVLFDEHVRESLAWSELEGGELRCWLLALLDRIPLERTPRWRFDDGERRDLHALFTLARAQPERVRLVVLAQPEELMRRVESFPGLQEAPWIDTAMRREDWLPIWLCHLYACEDRRVDRVKVWDLLAVWDRHVVRRKGRDVVCEVTGLRNRWEPERMGLYYCNSDRLLDEIGDLSPYLRRAWRSFVLRSRRALRRGGELPDRYEHDPHRQEVLRDALGEPERLLDVLELVGELKVE